MMSVEKIKHIIDNKTCWVRDEHTNLEAKAISNLIALFDDLGIMPLITIEDDKNNELIRVTDSEKQEAEIYFNILYRCDFYIDIERSNQNYTTNIKVKSKTGCDIAVPGKILLTSSNNESSQLTINDFILLGLDPFCADEKDFSTDSKRNTVDWGNNHFTGKKIESYLSGINLPSEAQITVPNSPNNFKNFKTLYAGLLCLKSAKPFSPKELKKWLENATGKTDKTEACNLPKEVCVLFAQQKLEENNEIPPQWVGIFWYKDDLLKKSIDEWKPIKELVSNEYFWKAMLATGVAKNEEVGLEGMGILWEEE